MFTVNFTFNGENERGGESSMSRDKTLSDRQDFAKAG